MKMWWILAQMSLLMFNTCFAGVCRLLPCIIEPKQLRFLYHTMEIDASSINVHKGDDVSITCDGSCVGINYNPHLGWYGPDRHRIGSQDPSDRIYVERDWSNKYQKLHIRSAQQSDEGPYYCRGKLGDKIGWRIKSIIIYIVPRHKHGDNHSGGLRRDNYSSTTATLPRITQLTRAVTTQTTPSPSTSASSTVHTTVYSTKKHRTTTTAISETSYLNSTTPAEPDVTKETTSTAGSQEGITTASTSTTGPTSNCSSDEFQCSNGDCISNDLRCDTVPDCYHGDDEENCESFFQSCNESELACDNNIGCFTKSQTCDGYPQCQDGSDEFLYRCERNTDITFG